MQIFKEYLNMGVSKNNGTPKSSISIGFSIINHLFWGTTIFGNTHHIIFVPTVCLGLREVCFRYDV